MAYIKMWIFLNILSFLHYLITACTPSDSGVTKITAFSGESVLLPCTCTNTQDKPKSFSWETKSRRASKDGIYIDIFSVFELYRNRITLLNQTSPGNVSLLLSDLTEDDQGSYVCLLETTSRFIDVFVKKRIESTPLSKTSLSVLISVPFLVIGGAAVIYYIHRAHKKARMETGKINVENNLDDHNSTYGILQRKYDAEEMYGTIGNRPKDQ
ncbi:cell surface A33 antigen-like isoform X1 [Chanodichthys erythropterus]|uniref:cell surface A33 antigen-like isoform X1 n=1 Tax=Chanodichthys erythropterus TaxID=933992 RepID=UPI00351F03BA